VTAAEVAERYVKTAETGMLARAREQVLLMRIQTAASIRPGSMEIKPDSRHKSTNTKYSSVRNAGSAAPWAKMPGGQFAVGIAI
jgi:hypothetical protein